MPETPTACALDWLSSETSSVLILPGQHHLDDLHVLAAGDAHAVDELALPRPSYSIVYVISGPPPCTTIGRRPARPQQVDVVREARLERVLHHRRAAVLDDRARVREPRDVAERLDEERALEAGAVVGEPVVARDRPVGRGVREARVVGVDLHVVVAEVAAPRGRARVALGQAHLDEHVRLAHLRAERQRVGARRRAGRRTRTSPARAPSRASGRSATCATRRARRRRRARGPSSGRRRRPRPSPASTRRRRARARAPSPRSGAPEMRTSMSFVAPSPSSAIWRARSMQSASSVSTSASNSGVPSRDAARSPRGRWPARRRRRWCSCRRRR